MSEDITLSHAPKVNPGTPEETPSWRALRDCWFSIAVRRARRRWSVIALEGAYPDDGTGAECSSAIDGKTRRVVVAIDSYSAAGIAHALSLAFNLGFAAGQVHQARVDRRMQLRGLDLTGPEIAPAPGEAVSR